jgi:hypothetical protein
MMDHVLTSERAAVVAEATDDTLAAYVEIERRVDDAEGAGILARWEFGRALLIEREANGGRQLPHGRLAEVCEATGKGEREIRYRLQLAEKYRTREEVGTAVPTFGSWTELRQSLTESSDPTVTPTRSEKRAQKLTEQIREKRDQACTRLAVTAWQMHTGPDPLPWSTIGDALERELYEESSAALEPALGTDDFHSFWHHAYGTFFDTVRATSCEDHDRSDCALCTPERLAWSEEHPASVLKHEHGRCPCSPSGEEAIR